MAKDRPRNLVEMKVVEFQGYEVSQWHPLPDGKGAPTQIHVALQLGEFTLVLRLKSRRAVDEMIDTLAKHRDEVWPDSRS